MDIAFIVCSKFSENVLRWMGSGGGTVDGRTRILMRGALSIGMPERSNPAADRMNTARTQEEEIPLFFVLYGRVGIKVGRIRRDHTHEEKLTDRRREGERGPTHRPIYTCMYTSNRALCCSARPPQGRWRASTSYGASEVASKEEPFRSYPFAH